MPRRLATFALAVLAACSDLKVPTWMCDPARQTGCAAGQYCETIGSTGAACFAPVIVAGSVTDPTTVGTTYVSGARVVALDANRAPASSVAVTGGAGAYEVAVRAARDANGRPAPAFVTLRADAQGYQTFPGGIRPALPIDVSTAAPVNGRWVVSGPLTQVQLLPLAGPGASWIAGTVARVPGVAAPLVVADPLAGGAGVTGIADRDGSYAIFNLAQGVPYVVRAYVQGANYPPATTGPLAPGANVVAIGAPTPTSAAVTATSGLIYNNGASSNIDVTLVVESTYVSTLDRGETPPGLTVHASGNDYAFPGVPDGAYRVLAAFRVDGDVRDQSSTGNATPPFVTVAGGLVSAAPEPFKIVPSVDLRAIGGVPVGVDPVVPVATPTPSFAWSKGSVDANADLYRVIVLDAFGNTVWSHDEPAIVNDYSVAYGGAALVAGRPYQLRILAVKTTPSVEQVSQTEDLLGVFTYLP